MSGLDPTITATLSNSETLTFFAEPEGKPGHYAATLTFPKDGDWEWSIQAFTMDLKMPALSVSAAGAVSMDQPVVKPESQFASVPPLLIIRVSILAIGLVGLVVVFRSRSRTAMALTGLCLLIGITSFMMESAIPQVEAQGKSSSEVTVDSSISQVELGRQLFIAKGCITCHVNSRATRDPEYWTIEVGATNLSNFSAHPDVLRMRLTDPAIVKSDTKMPKLHLSESEIEALVVFINSK